LNCQDAKNAKEEKVRAGYSVVVAFRRWNQIPCFLVNSLYSNLGKKSDMTASTISSKGQTTIPVEIQRRLNVKPGDKLQYFLEADGRVSLVPKSLSLKDLSGVLPPPKTVVSVEDMNRAITGHAADLDRSR
jgi:antitoxin PrlF